MAIEIFFVQEIYNHKSGIFRFLSFFMKHVSRVQDLNEGVVKKIKNKVKNIGGCSGFFYGPETSGSLWERSVLIQYDVIIVGRDPLPDMWGSVTFLPKRGIDKDSGIISVSISPNNISY